MATRVIFHRVVQDAKEFGSDEQKSVSRVYFDLEEDGEMYRDLFVDVTEPVGSAHHLEDIKVGEVRGVPASVNRENFEGAVKGYYRSLVTSAGYGKHLAKGKGFRTHGDTLGREQVVEL